MFTYNTQIRLHHTDAAGRLFYAHQFVLIHEAFEMFLDQEGLPLSKMLADETISIPIVHAESDYRFPLKVGDAISINLTVSKIGTTSFTIHYSIQHEDDQIAGEANTVHVCVNKRSFEKQEIPDQLRACLDSHRTKF